MLSNILLICVVLFGGILVLFLKEKITGSLKYILAFSGAFMLAVSVLHLIPEVYASDGFSIGIYVLIGFLIQLILEYFSQGIEHGHIHVHGNKSSLYLAPIFISLCIHAFMEGLPLSIDLSSDAHTHSHTLHHDGSNSFLISILLHKLPIAIALMTLLIKANIRTPIAFLLLILFALMAPVGNLAGSSFQYFFESNVEVMNQVLAVVLGMFLHISTTILFESDESHKFNLMKLLIIIAGGVTAYLVL